jgi:hypothetical protein
VQFRFFSENVDFSQAGAADDPIARGTCDRKLKQIRRTFRLLVDAGVFHDGDREEHRAGFEEMDGAKF